MPAGLADAVLAVLARDRPVPAVAATAIARLAAPEDAVAEVQLDPPDGALAAVIGFAAPGTRALIASGAVDPATGAAAGAPVIRWLDAVAPHARHWGIKLGAATQLYARGRFDALLAAAITGAGGPGLDRQLAAAGAAGFAMLGVELAGGAIARHVGYVAVSDPQAPAALAAARGLAGLPDAGDLALLTPGTAWTHLSWDLATPGGPVKLDVGARPAGEAIALAARLGLDGAALAARLAALGLGDPSHVGLRLGAPRPRALALYFRITAS